MYISASLVAQATVIGVARGAQTSKTNWRFNFGRAPAKSGYISVPASTHYTRDLGYGFVGDADSAGNSNDPQAITDDSCDGDKPRFFAVDLPEGNYEISFKLGNKNSASTTTLRAEARRLLLERFQTSAGKFATRKFTVNVRYKELKAGGTVRLKPDEKSNFDWDHRLTLELNDTRPCVVSLEIKPAHSAITVYLAGDSTVTDQSKEPWCSWGQMLPRFFKSGVAIANHAESGESLKSFIGERRLQKILETIRARDYLFIQFAHNDQKPGSSHVDPFTTYKEHLQLYIGEARKRGAIPVLVTSMHRRSFDAQGKIMNTLGDYPEAMRQLAKEQNVPLIDLNSASKKLFEALGPEGTLKAFVHYPSGAFTGQEKELKDDTHFNAYGAYELARCVVEGIKSSKLGIAKYLVRDVAPFDPARPDPINSWSLPASPPITNVQTEGIGN